MYDQSSITQETSLLMSNILIDDERHNGNSVNENFQKVNLKESPVDYFGDEGTYCNPYEPQVSFDLTKSGNNQHSESLKLQSRVLSEIEQNVLFSMSSTDDNVWQNQYSDTFSNKGIRPFQCSLDSKTSVSSFFPNFEAIQENIPPNYDYKEFESNYSSSGCNYVYNSNQFNDQPLSNSEKAETMVFDISSNILSKNPDNRDFSNIDLIDLIIPDNKLERVLLVSKIPEDMSPYLFLDVCTSFGHICLLKTIKTDTYTCQVLVGWYDLRNAKNAFSSLKDQLIQVQPMASGIEVDYFDYSEQILDFDLRELNPSIAISCESAHTTNRFSSALLLKLQEFGDIRTFKEHSEGTNMFICEFFDSRSVSKVLSCFTHTFIAGAEVFITEYTNKPNYEFNDSFHGLVEPQWKVTTGGFQNELCATEDEYLRTGCLDLNPVPVSSQNQEKAKSDNIVTMSGVPKRNIVNLDNIAKGLDKRTTLMLRNIPNKVDQKMLKEYIDVTNRNTYDFLYLRIDFINRCNVGYAFISFTDPKHIITFAKARAGTKWNKFNSEKICDLSYANVQGKQALIEKFRNSTVMDQEPAYRPKIFYTEGPLKGKEQPFPPPNNLNRRIKSIASVQQVGLFPPTNKKKEHNFWQPKNT